MNFGPGFYDLISPALKNVYLLLYQLHLIFASFSISYSGVMHSILRQPQCAELRVCNRMIDSFFFCFWVKNWFKLSLSNHLLCCHIRLNISSVILNKIEAGTEEMGGQGGQLSIRFWQISYPA